MGKTERCTHFKRTFVRTDTSTRRMPKQKQYSLRRCQRICQVAYFLMSSLEACTGLGAIRELKTLRRLYRGISTPADRYEGLLLGEGPDCCFFSLARNAPF